MGQTGSGFRFEDLGKVPLIIDAVYEGLMIAHLMGEWMDASPTDMPRVLSSLKLAMR